MAASRSILEIVRTVASRVGLGRPTTATGSTDVQIQQLVELANQEGQELAARFGWQALTKEATFSAVATESQGDLDGTIVASAQGFDRIINETVWNRTTQVGPGGPLSPRSWQVLKSTSYAPNPWGYFRVRGGQLLLTPAPTAGNTLAFEYITRNWVSNVTEDAFRDYFSADDDFPLLDSRLIQLGLTWRWKAAKGLSFAQDHDNYENAVLDAMTRDEPRSPLSLNGGSLDAVEPFVLVPRGSWDL